MTLLSWSASAGSPKQRKGTSFYAADLSLLCEVIGQMR